MTNFSDITDRDELHAIIWDAGKDATGIRPRWIDFEGSTIQELQETAAHYCQRAEEEARREAEVEAEAVAEYEALVESNIEMGAGDRETAVRWIVQAHASERYIQDVDCILYHSGMPFFEPKLPAHIKPELEAALDSIEQVF